MEIICQYLESEQDSDESDDSESDSETESEEEEGEDAAAKQLEVDEDCEKPQYIPKRGDFYEHDVRKRETVEEAPEPAAQTILKPTTTLHRHYQSKPGTIFGVSKNPQSNQHPILK